MHIVFRLARNLSVKTWYGCYFAPAWSTRLGMLVQKQAISTNTGGIEKTKALTSKESICGQLSEANISTSTDDKQLNIRYPPRSSKRFLWTEEKDAVLREGIAKHRKDGWPKVAEFVGGGVTYQQCYRRAAFLAQKGIKRGAWDQDELRRLEELVPQYLVHSYWSPQLKQMTKEYTDWDGVGKELGRLSRDCCNKWNNLQCGKLKKGRFTAEEDALIMQRVAEWKCEGSGLWTALEKEMGRASDVIQRRWNILTSTFQKSDLYFWWTDLMVKRLTEGVAKHKAEGWAKVAKYMGGGVTAAQCRKRWNTYYAHGNVKRGAWDQDEEERLAELVPQHLVPSYLSKNTGRMTKEHIEWTKVAAKLGRLSIDCKGKWIAMQNATMKKGPFTDSENATIRERVEGWDGKRSELWRALGKDLGRPAVAIRVHWVSVSRRE